MIKKGKLITTTPKRRTAITRPITITIVFAKLLIPSYPRGAVRATNDASSAPQIHANRLGHRRNSGLWRAVRCYWRHTKRI